jgi:hypothetical protein
MKREVERKLLLGMKRRSECMRLSGKLVSRLGARVRWVNLGMLVVVGASFKLLVRMRLRGWSRIGGGRGCECEGIYVFGNLRYGTTCIRSSIAGLYAGKRRGMHVWMSMESGECVTATRALYDARRVYGM